MRRDMEEEGKSGGRVEEEGWATLAFHPDKQNNRRVTSKVGRFFFKFIFYFIFCDSSRRSVGGNLRDC